MVVRSCLQQLASKHLHVLFKDIKTLLNKWRFFPEITLYIPLLIWKDVLLKSEGLNVQVPEL